jgi:hypothetical protein
MDSGIAVKMNKKREAEWQWQPTSTTQSASNKAAVSKIA